MVIHFVITILVGTADVLSRLRLLNIYMKAIGIHSRQLKAWHRTTHSHPIFNPDYARENLASLGVKFVMIYLYVATLIIGLHLWVLNGLLEAETLTWLIIESNARNIMLDVPDSIFLNKTSVMLALIFAVIVTIVARWSLDIFKASFHPGATEKVNRFLAKKELLPKPLLKTTVDLRGLKKSKAI